VTEEGKIRRPKTAVDSAAKTYVAGKSTAKDPENAINWRCIIDRMMAKAKAVPAKVLTAKEYR